MLSGPKQRGGRPVRETCATAAHTATERRHLAQMHTPTEGGASPEGLLCRLSLSFPLLFFLAFSPFTRPRWMQLHRAINLLPRSLRWPPLSSDTRHNAVPPLFGSSLASSDTFASAWRI